MKSGIRVHKLLSADNIWMTCCALHNWLLEIDGLSEQWNNSGTSDYKGALGNFEDNVIPFALQRLFGKSINNLLSD